LEKARKKTIHGKRENIGVRLRKIPRGRCTSNAGKETVWPGKRIASAREERIVQNRKVGVKGDSEKGLEYVKMIWMRYSKEGEWKRH